jgi:hypothetical protein
MHKYNELLYFVGKCLTIDKQPDNLQEIKNLIIAENIDWDKFVTLCSIHLITPVLYLKFQKTNILQLLPKELEDYLKEIYELSKTRNKLIINQIKEICDLLAKNNIYPILLKGAGNLIDNIYSDTGERIMGDIDLLVDETEYLEAAGIFTNVGYTESKLLYYDDVTILKHYPRLSHPDKNASVEIHRIPVDEDYLKLFNQEMIREQIKRVDGYPNCYVLSDKHKILLNFIHSQLTNKGHKSGVVSLRDVYDLYLLSGKVNLTNLLPQIKPHKKAQSYFLLSQKILGTDIGFSAKQTLHDKWLLYKFDKNFNSKMFYVVNKTLTELYDRIIIRYFGLIFKSFYSKKVRTFMLMRLSKSGWYKSQINSWKNTFRIRN